MRRPLKTCWLCSGGSNSSFLSPIQDLISSSLLYNPTQTLSILYPLLFSSAPTLSLFATSSQPLNCLGRLQVMWCADSEKRAVVEIRNRNASCHLTNEAMMKERHKNCS